MRIRTVTSNTYFNYLILKTFPCQIWCPFSFLSISLISCFCLTISGEAVLADCLFCIQMIWFTDHGKRHPCATSSLLPYGHYFDICFNILLTLSHSFSFSLTLSLPLSSFFSFPLISFFLLLMWRWFLFGSIFITAASAVVLANSYNEVIGTDDSFLSRPAFRASWALLVVSGAFCTIGSVSTCLIC